MVQHVPRRLEPISQPARRIHAFRCDVLQHHWAAPAARRERRRRHRCDCYYVSARAPRRDLYRDDRPLLALRRSGLDVRVPAGLSVERSLGQDMGHTEADAAHGPTTSTYVAVWIGLILIVAVKTGLTSAHFSAGWLLVALLLLAIVEATVALRYFMHLKYEPPALAWTLIPAVVFALLMMNQFWADAHRLTTLRFPSP